MTIRVLGTTWCSDCTRSKALLDARGVDYEWSDTDEDADAAALAASLNHGVVVVPTILLEDGSILVEPSDAELLAALGLD